MPANTYRAKKLIRSVALGLQKIHACPNHCFLYRGTQYVSLESCLHCDVSQYKRNARCHMDANDEGASSELKNKVSKKSSAKHISSHEEDQESYTHKRIHAQVM